MENTGCEYNRCRPWQFEHDLQNFDEKKERKIISKACLSPSI